MSVTPEDIRTAAFVITLLVAPGALIFIIMVLRSYTIDIHVHRDGHRRRQHLVEEDNDDD